MTVRSERYLNGTKRKIEAFAVRYILKVSNVLYCELALFFF